MIDNLTKIKNASKKGEITSNIVGDTNIPKKSVYTYDMSTRWKG